MGVGWISRWIENLSQNICPYAPVLTNLLAPERRLHTVFRKYEGAMLHTLFAVFGSIAFAELFRPFYRPTSGQIFILMEWIRSLTGAALAAVLVQRFWKISGAEWAWVIPSASFALAYLRDLLLARGTFDHFSGHDCAIQTGGTSCQDFFLFTVPFLRAVSYTLAARVMQLHSKSGPP